MLRATVDTIAAVCGGTVVLGEGEMFANGLAVDSREVQPGCAFVALPGERVDGHEFLSAAIDEGARVLVVTRDEEAVAPLYDRIVHRGVAVVRVADGLRAVQDLAAWHRSRLHCAVVGITGSTGKTSTKDFLTSALATTVRVVATAGNRNNELGVPLTVLAAGSDTDVLVVEMGMRGLGQIARLAEIARPTMGLVTNVGTSHIELLGDQESVANAKGELVRAVPDDGAVFLNGDDAYSETLAATARGAVTFYGTEPHCAVRAEGITLDDESHASFEMLTPQGEAHVELGMPGRHNVYNALAAAAVALRLAVPLDRVAEGLSGAALTAMRMQSFSTAEGVSVINDAYNANPTSMRAAVDTLAAMRVPGRRVAVLGDMAELGSLTELAHFRLGEEVARAGIDTLVTVGERAVRIAAGARAEGMEPGDVRPCVTTDEASEVLDDLLEPGDAVLVKASRCMGLERVVEGLVSPRVG